MSGSRAAAVAGVHWHVPRALAALAALLITCVALLASSSVASADWTGDGAADVLAVDANGSMRVYRGSGAGLFTDAGQRIDGSGSAWNQYTDLFHAGGDFTSDGHPDVFGRAADGTLRIFRGNGAGGFLDNGTLNGGGWGAFTAVLAPGDFSGDGVPDVLARNSAGAMLLFRGSGLGSFLDNGVQIGAGWNAFDGIYPASDFSGDGHADVLARKPDGSLFLYRGNGAGLFLGSGIHIGGGWHGMNAIVPGGDFTGDGKSDVLARTHDGSFKVYRGNGTGGFADNGTVIGGGWNTFTALITPGDFSGDGKPDVLARLADGTLRLLRGNNAGGLIDNGEPAGGDWGTATDVMAPGDFTGDGKPDLLVRTAQGTLKVHPGTGTGRFAESGKQVGSGWGHFRDVIAPGDFNGDGKPDVLARTTDGAMRLYRGTGASGFIDGGVQIGAGWSGFTDIHPAGDFDGDGHVDVFGRTASGWLYVYRGNGSGLFADNGTALGQNWDSFTALMSGGDFSGDGLPDVLARKSDGAMLLYRGNGHGSFIDNGGQIGAGWNAFDLMVLSHQPQYPTSARYGGPDGSINTEEELDAVLLAMESNFSEDKLSELIAGLTPVDHEFVGSSIPDAPDPEDDDPVATASSPWDPIWACSFVGETIPSSPGKFRPRPPYYHFDPETGSEWLIGNAGFRCTNSDITKVIRIKVCLDMWSLTDAGRVGWVHKKCDSDTFSGAQAFADIYEGVQKNCPQLIMVRSYKVSARLTVWNGSPTAVNRIGSATRSSLKYRFPCLVN